LNVELIQMRSDLQLAGLASGEIDFTPSVGPAGAAIANGLPLKALAILYRAPLFSLVSPSSVSSARDLEGKTVAVPASVGKPPVRLAHARKRRRRPQESNVYSNGQHNGKPDRAPTGVRSAPRYQPPFYGNHGGEGVQDSWAKSISAGGRPVARSGCQSAKLERQPEQARNILRSMRDVIAVIKREKRRSFLISKKLQSECGQRQ